MMGDSLYPDAPGSVQCASGFAEDRADHPHRCALNIATGPHEDCRHICEAKGCDRQWSEDQVATPRSPGFRFVLVEQPGVTR